MHEDVVLKALALLEREAEIPCDRSGALLYFGTPDEFWLCYCRGCQAKGRLGKMLYSAQQEIEYAETGTYPVILKRKIP